MKNTALALLIAWDQIPHVLLHCGAWSQATLFLACIAVDLHSNLWSLQITDELPKFHLGLLEAWNWKCFSLLLQISILSCFFASRNEPFDPLENFILCCKLELGFRFLRSGVFLGLPSWFILMWLNTKKALTRQWCVIYPAVRWAISCICWIYPSVPF